jgi:hypothetical protein
MTQDQPVGVVVGPAVERGERLPADADEDGEGNEDEQREAERQPP